MLRSRERWQTSKQQILNIVYYYLIILSAFDLLVAGGTHNGTASKGISQHWVLVPGHFSTLSSSLALSDPLVGRCPIPNTKFL